MGDALDLWSEVSENHDSLDDYFQEYAGGRLTAEAKAIYEALLEHGPLDIIRLRWEARMSAESAKSRFEQALVELEVGLKVYCRWEWQRRGHGVMRLFYAPCSDITGCAVPLLGRPWHTDRTSDTDSVPAACLLEV